MKKKIIALCLAVCLIAIAAVTGTMAYLTDYDQATNVMVYGNVSIQQHEYQRDKNDDGSWKTDTIDGVTSYVLEEFEQDKPLFPAIIPNGGTVGGTTWNYDAIPVRMSQVDSHGGASVFNTPNAVDKFVTVENDGKSDAYVRTLIAFEIGSANLTDPNFPNQQLLFWEMRATTADKNTTAKQPWTIGFNEVVSINGNNYLVFELIYTGASTSNGMKHENGVLPAGQTTYPSLCQVYLASRATNEDCIALDGNGNGKCDILVLSQAVQAEGWYAGDGKLVAEIALDTAFGDVTAALLQQWFA